METLQYHSQAATRQDQWVIEKTGGLRGGYYVEIGAHNGLRHSNTLTLEQSFGWTGLLVEANPALVSECQKNRPNSKVIEAVIGPFNMRGLQFATSRNGGGDSDMFSGLVAHMSPEWKDSHESHGSRYSHVNTITLNNVLGQSGAPPRINYLSLDVEGAEYAILESFLGATWPKGKSFQIDLMTVEFLYDRMRLERLEELLEPQYVLDEVRAFDACFIHRSLV